jgi:8-oxo-dGTP diphosphatase
MNKLKGVVMTDSIRVTAAVIEQAGKIFIARRKSGHHRSCWEFPGGKLKCDETPEACLQRELCEELEITAEVGEFLTESIYDQGDKIIQLLAYRVPAFHGTMVLHDHDLCAWVYPWELRSYTFSPADIPIIEHILAKE